MDSPNAAVSRQDNVVNPLTRCSWARTPLSIAYHDAEWGVPVHDDTIFFEFLILEGAQAGLSWETILKKREAYREAFLNFDPAGRPVHPRASRAAASERRDRSQPAQDREHGPERAGIPRGAEGVRQLRRLRLGVRRWRSAGEQPGFVRRIPARTAESDALSRDLLPRGFKFVGSTICYAFMQAVGLVNDHTTDCFRHALVGRSRPAHVKTNKDRRTKIHDLRADCYRRL